MRTGLPQRLSSEQYMNLSSSYRIFRHRIAERIDVHCHEFYELGCVTSGRGRQFINGDESDMGQGTVFLLTPADFHELDPDPGQEIELYNLIFSADMLEPSLFELLFRDRNWYGHVFGPPEYDAMKAEFDRIWSESQNAQTGSQMIVRGALERILIDLYRAAAREQADSGKDRHSAKQAATDSLIRSAMLYIQHRFREPLTLDQVAGHCNLSANYFSECFRKATGVSFQSYVISSRLDFARSLLLVSGLSVTEVCMASGFNTLAHFERMFKKRFGASPKQYKKLAEGDGRGAAD